MMNDNTFGFVKNACDKAIEEGFLPFAATLMIQDGKELCYYETGYKDVENKVPFTRDTICRLYSLSKSVTSVAVHILLERGIISLCEPVSKYLPGFEKLMVEENGSVRKPKRPLHIRELLSMQSGLLYNGKGLAGEDGLKRFTFIEETCQNPDSMTTVEFANYLGEGIAKFDARDGWAYGSGADVLGAIVEVASGKRFGDFLREEIFEPLGMKDTGFFVPEEKLSRLSNTYKERTDAMIKDVKPHLGVLNAPVNAPNFESGGAGLFSTVDDLARFGTMLLNKGEWNGKRILSEKTFKTMTTPQLTDTETEWYWNYFGLNRGFSYGNLMRINVWPEKGYCFGEAGEFGWDGYMGCYMSVIPSKNALLFFMTQKGATGFNYVTKKLRNIAFSQIFE